MGHSDEKNCKSRKIIIKLSEFERNACFSFGKRTAAASKVEPSEDLLFTFSSRNVDGIAMEVEFLEYVITLADFHLENKDNKVKLYTVIDTDLEYPVYPNTFWESTVIFVHT